MSANLKQSDYAGQDNATKRILLVDNQAHILRVMKSTFDRKGYEVDTALSGELALAMLRTREYDVLIADSRLEKFDGKQFIDTVKAQLQSDAPAMFLVTDKNNVELASEWNEELDRIECLQKPISLHYIIGRLNELFGVDTNEQSCQN